MNQSVLSGILRWSLSQGDGLQPNEDVQPMSEEDSRFLHDAFEAFTIDEAQRMRIIASTLALPETEAGLRDATARSTDWIDALQQVPKGVKEGDSVSITQEMNKSKPKHNTTATPTTTSAQPTPQQRVEPASIDYAQLLREVVQRKEGALDELDDRVLTLDNAADFWTVGGFPPLLAALRSPHPSVAWRAAQCLATLCQNNPRCQRYAYDSDALTPLLHTLAHRPPQPTADQQQCATKSLYALSALLRSAEVPFVRAFLDEGGLEVLVGVVLGGGEWGGARSAAKCMALLRLVLTADEGAESGVAEVGDKLGWWEGVKRWIGSEDINAREECMRLLKAGSERSCKVAIRGEPGLVAAVKQRVEACERMTGEEREICEEELEAGKQVLHNLST